MQIEEALLSKFGPLLTTTQLAQILDRSTEGLRISLRAGSEWALAINATRLKLGRRVYFRTTDVAKILSGA